MPSNCFAIPWIGARLLLANMLQAKTALLEENVMNVLDVVVDG
jgi:hypothetical protein